MKRLLLLLTICAFLVNSINSKAQSPTKKNASGNEAVEKQAYADWQAGKAKYYTFGLIRANDLHEAIIEQKYRIDIVPRGCVVVPNDLQYNQVIDKLMKETYGKTLSEIKRDLAEE